MLLANRNTPQIHRDDRDSLMRKLEQQYFKTIAAIDISHLVSTLNTHDGRIQISFPEPARKQ
jgi:hypothetical protein